ncbi:MAG: PEP-CTERM sorting domain-containing protein [Burkholderiales bacterium]|nr:PEP-CTERM sorting domain-containing protein [Burkholderiales bacterium]
MNTSQRLVVVAALLAAGGVQAALQPGDIAFTAFNADEDGFALVALRDIAPYTSIYFSDNEWSGGAPASGSFNGGENTYAWISGAAPIGAGTVVRFSAIDRAARSASSGAFGLIQAGAPGFSASGDSLFAFSADASAAPTRFLAAISSEAFAGSDLAGTGLAIGAHAIAVGSGADFAEYSGPRAGLAAFAAYAALVNDVSQWQSRASGEFATLAPNVAAFGIAPVPEPQTYALLAAGLSLIGWRLRRRDT